MESAFFKLDPALSRVADTAMEAARETFARIDRITEYNQQKVLAAFVEGGVSESHFVATTGYGYNDRGRDKLEEIFARVMGAEDALVRHSLVSGTHAIAVALFGLLRPGDLLLAVTGEPYDTLQGVIRNSCGSLEEYGVAYRAVPLKNGAPDPEAIVAALKEEPKAAVVHIQRSRGYDPRPSLTVEKIREVIKAVRSVREDITVFVDNCYGEFAETEEPIAAGADIMAGSLIKNPGGGVAENGGYICGRADLVEKCSYRMTTPGLGREVGASLGHNRSLFMGLFHAPHVVGEAMKTAVFCASLFHELGYETSPTVSEPRGDIIQTLLLRSPEALVAFCQGMQKGAPVDSFVVPEPWDMPGYDDPVIMAAGAFIMGASIELSADAPLRPPYAAYMQGGLNFHSGKVGVLLAAESMIEKGVITL